MAQSFVEEKEIEREVDREQCNDAFCHIINSKKLGLPAQDRASENPSRDKTDKIEK